MTFKLCAWLWMEKAVEVMIVGTVGTKVYMVFVTHILPVVFPTRVNANIGGPALDVTLRGTHSGQYHSDSNASHHCYGFHLDGVELD